MRALIQRVSKAYVEVNEKKISSIDKGLLVLLGVHEPRVVPINLYLLKKFFFHSLPHRL